MTGIELAVGATMAAAFIGLALVSQLRPSTDRLMRERLCDRVVVTLKTGSSFAGVLFKIDDKVVVLRETQALGAGPNGANLIVDGELLLARTDIDFLQRP